MQICFSHLTPQKFPIFLRCLSKEKLDHMWWSTVSCNWTQEFHEKKCWILVNEETFNIDIFKMSIRFRRILALSRMVCAHVYPTSRKIIRSCLPRVHFIKFELPEWQTRRRKTKALRCLPPCRISPLLHPEHRFSSISQKGDKKWKHNINKYSFLIKNNFIAHKDGEQKEKT